jgi:S-adenosylmethionine hydrolase
LETPTPAALPGGWRGEVIAVDHFGNLSTNISAAQIEGRSDWVIRAGEKEIRGVSRTFGEQAPGALVAMIDSDQRLAIAVVNGDAAAELGLDAGAPVEVVSP